MVSGSTFAAMSTFFSVVKSKPAEVGFSISHYFFSGLGQSFFLGLFTLPLATSLGIDRLELASLYASATLVSAFGLALIGQRLNNRQLLNLGPWVAVILPLVLFVLTQVNQSWQLFVVYVMMRLGGQGLMPLMGSTYVVNIMGKQRGKGLSLGALGATFSELILPPVVTGVMVIYGWKFAVCVVAVAMALIYLTARLSLKRHSEMNQISDASQAKPSPAWRLLRRPDFLVRVLLYTAPTMILTGFFIHPSLISEQVELPLIAVTSAMGFYGFMRIGGILLGGILTDRFTAVKVFRWAALPLALALVWLFAVEGFAGLIPYIVLIAICTSFSGISNAAMWAELYSVERYAAIKSLVGACMTVSTAVGAILVPALVESMGAGNTLLVLAAYVLTLLFLNSSIRPQPSHELNQKGRSPLSDL